MIGRCSIVPTAGMNLQNRRRLPVSIFSVKIAAVGSLKRVTGRIFIISNKFLSKDQAKTLILIFLSTKKNKIVKTLSACTESTEITYLLLKAFSKNIHLVAQSFRHKYILSVIYSIYFFINCNSYTEKVQYSTYMRYPFKEM